MTQTDTTLTFDVFRKALLSILEETFDNVHGAFLDPEDSLFPTLEDVSAQRASWRVGGESGNSIAGQVSHMIFYLDLVMRYMREENPGPQDWSIAWQLVAVNEREWKELKHQLRMSQRKLIDMLTHDPPEFTEEMVEGAMAMIAYNAFHLSQIRHALLMIGDGNRINADTRSLRTYCTVNDKVKAAYR